MVNLVKTKKIIIHKYKIFQVYKVAIVELGIKYYNATRK